MYVLDIGQPSLVPSWYMFKFAGGTLKRTSTATVVFAGPEKTAHQQASPEQTHWTALHYATITGNYDVVR
jgi:hypothetical protein